MQSQFTKDRASFALTSDKQRWRAAHAFAERGWYVQPLIGGTSRPMSCKLCWSESPDYVPHSGIGDCPHDPDHCHSFYAATVDHELIDSWFRRFPTMNVGIATEPSRLLIVDCDSAAHGPIADPAWQMPDVKDGLDVMQVIVERYGEVWPDDTMQVATPRNGLHLYWALPPEVAVRSIGGKFGPSIDIKGASAFIVAPTSTKPEGVYRRIGSVTAPAPAPEWLLLHLESTGHMPQPVQPRRVGQRPRFSNVNGTRRYVAKAVEAELDNVAACRAQRNAQLSASAFALGQFVGAGLLDCDDVHQALTDAAEQAGISPAERKAQDTIRRGLAAGARQPRTIPTGAQA